ncbi:MAG: serine/threonine-protein kinase [Planctomycetota bacterium]
MVTKLVTKPGLARIHVSSRGDILVADRIGAYSIVSELGSGGMGKVYLAEAPTEDGGRTRVALKVVHPHLLETPGFFKRFLREAEIGKRVEHENVVRTLDVDALKVAGEQLNFLVMEYVEGQTLRELLDELERVPEELCRHIGREVAQALRAIHEAGVVHRDLKPENVLITKDQVVKVMDLGVALPKDEAIKLTQTGSFFGTVHYAAPEQLEGVEPDRRADWYALGLMLYELATGRHPSMANDVGSLMRLRIEETPRPAGQVNPQLSAYFEEVLKGLLARDREQRLDFYPEEDSEWWRERAKAVRKETKRPLRRIRIPRETALYGRGAELAKLSELFERAKTGDAQVVLIEGEAGIGKSRLVDEFVGGLRGEVNFLFGAYPPGSAATAAGAFSTAYREHFGADGCAAWLTETPLLVSAFDAVLRGEPQPEGQEPLTRDSLQTVFVHATRAIAAEGPVIILIDDLHFAPEEGRSLFTALARAIPEHCVLLIGASRPGLPQDWIANLKATHLELSRLGPKDLVRLLEESFRSERLAAELAGQIAVKSDGNPFFAFEIIAGLREGQFITQAGDGTWARTQVIEQIRIPSSVMDLIQARIAELDEEDRDLLDVASCCGFQFDPLLVGEVVGLKRIPLLKRLAQIDRRHRLIRAAGTSYVFDHHQVQEALYESLSELLRREYHAALGESLEAGAGDAVYGALALSLAEHFLRGQCGERALHWLDAALDHLDASYLIHQAIALTDRALAVPGLLSGAARAGILLRQGERLDLLGRREEQKTVFAEALRLAEQAGDRALEARVHRARGTLHHRLAEHDHAIAAFERALKLWAAAGDKSGEASATANIGAVCKDMGRLAEAQERFTRAAALARECGNRQLEGSATGNLGIVYRNLGRFAEAKEHYERWLAVAREIGARRGEAMALGNLGIVYKNLGRLAEAKEHYRADLKLSREVGDRRSEAITLVNIGPHEACLGNPAAGAKALAESLAVAREIGERRVEGYGLHALGNLALAEGDTGRARRHFEEALALRREIGYPSGLGQTLLRLGRVAAAEGKEDEATRHFEEALVIAREVRSPELLVTSAVDRTLAPGGDVAAALEALKQHGPRLGDADKMEVHFDLWRVTGDRTHLEAAHGLLARMRAHAPEECRETMVENYPLHRGIVRAWEGR